MKCQYLFHKKILRTFDTIVSYSYKLSLVKMSSDEPVKKKMKEEMTIKMNKACLEDLFISNVQNCFSKKLSNSIGDQTEFGEVNGYPFFHTILPDFIQDEDFIEGLERELIKLSFREKNNDLYKFHQSEDLKHVDTPHLKAFCKLLQTDVKDWLINISGIPLTDNVDIFCSKYEYTDILLCHDDELEKRRIAYIYYLVPPTWCQSDGGTLDLFTADENIQPDEIVKSLVPKRNNFLFFEVTETSFHQVAEILSKEKTRLSISGWFHGPPLTRHKPYQEPPPTITPYITVDEDKFYNWINPVYLLPDIQGEISEKFESESEIQLTDFIQKDKYFELKKALEDSNISWRCQGPANKRKYYLCSDDNQSSIIKECVEFLQSDAMFLVLSNITGLKLHELAPESDEDSETSCAKIEDQTGQSSSQQNEDLPRQGSRSDKSNTSTDKGSISSRCHSEVRRWCHGCYTLAHDTSHDLDVNFSLDAVLFVGCSEWKTEFGGFTSYIAKDEDDELLCVSPEENCLALVYRDKSTLRFTKHINHTSVDQLSHQYFYDISTVYYE